VAAVGCAAGGTIAWMYSQTQAVENVFTHGGIGVAVSETQTPDGDDDPDTNRYSMAPGASIQKDPVVRLTAGSENAWLFVRLDESENFGAFLSYAIADGWTALENTPGVYYRITQQAEEEQVFQVLLNDTVTVKPGVTEAILNSLTAETYPTLAISACAVQLEGIETPHEAYALAANESSAP